MPVPMQSYRDPAGQFVIDYPSSWHAQVAPTGMTLLYADDPSEGIVFGVLPRKEIPLVIRADEFIASFAELVRQSYPDFRVTRQFVRPGLVSGEYGDFEAEWTNRWGLSMHGKVIFTLHPTPSTTVLHTLQWQTPVIGEAVWLPVFDRMVRSYRDTP